MCGLFRYAISCGAPKRTISDVLVGGYLTYLIFVLVRYLFFRNGKYEFTFKEKAALAEGESQEDTPAAAEEEPPAAEGGEVKKEAEKGE